ncbi:energy-coupling factor transporter transmembrane component T family protein [Oscillospiraceae bacterium LCP25S3_E10]|nr:energy-coupling factor transporter transmembrane protein EcfT [Ruminococcus sp.]MDD6447828.1 energy-coupling factor transporter transmembrane component T [Ruminococcus sp.]MDY2857117.1 energy-coupling factor transporter transmembrane component T [Oscillospiraceae bacterium]
MIKDITLGQFFPGNSVIHKIDPRVKILLIIAYIVFLFVANNFVSLGFMALVTVAIVLLTKIPVKMYFKGLKAIMFIILFTSVLNMFYGSGEPIWQWGFLKITLNGISNAVFISIRIVALIFISCVLTYTTSPTDLTDALERLMKPLTVLHIKVHEIAMMMTIALRFVPTLLEETDKIMSAQKARGANMDSGGLIKRVKAMMPVLVPLLVSAFNRAYELAVAMECRCYRGGGGRTRMKVLKAGTKDAVAVAVSVFVLAGVIVCNVMFGAIAR